jgi:hypothetical protein
VAVLLLQLVEEEGVEPVGHRIAVMVRKADAPQAVVEDLEGSNKIRGRFLSCVQPFYE